MNLKIKKNKEYLGISLFLEQRNLRICVRWRKKILKRQPHQRKATKPLMKIKKKALQNKLSKIESQIKQLERDIQQDDKMLTSNYDKHIEDAKFFTA
jgi:ATP-binding cassette subfamily F protein 3